MNFYKDFYFVYERIKLYNINLFIKKQNKKDHKVMMMLN